MTINEYQKLAMTTLNPALSEKDVLINGVMGLCGESGEAIDIVKKHLAQGHELDREHLIKELGIAILIAVALLLTSCGIIFRNEIREVFEEFFVKLTYDGDDESAESIKDVYCLGYVPEGYALKRESATDLYNKYVT